MDPSVIEWHQMLVRLSVALLVGALIGLEREHHGRPAGLRTHILVSMASALFAMISIIAAGKGNDPGRIAAQVVTGIGFLGAGTIMRHGSTIRGLTTAASLWMSAALGLAAGFGWYLGAAATGVAALLVLSLIRLLEDHIPKRKTTVTVLIFAKPGRDALPEALGVIRRLGGTVVRVTFGEETQSEGTSCEIVFNSAPGVDARVTFAALEAVDSIDHAGPSNDQGAMGS